MDLDLEMPPLKLKSENSTWESREAQAEKQVSELTAKEEALTQTAIEVGALLSETEARAEMVREEKEALETKLRNYEERAAGIIDRDALKPDRIVEQRRQAAERLDVLEKLTRRVLTLERALDSAQRSAMMAELYSETQSLTTKKQDIADTIQRMSTVRKWFTEVRDVLDRQSSNSVAKHVLAFGPLTTVIQKRLRSVYGFGDVSLLARGNEIRVVVDWKGEEVKPTDYFSDSQKQILMVSLFLAARLTQTWSGFAPILMDDPVTHFDDLNAFGFVELIRGLASTSPGKRQFFISTCEDRLFEVMRKKFSSVEGGAKFYRFDGIDLDGPLVSEIQS